VKRISDSIIGEEMFRLAGEYLDRGDIQRSWAWWYAGEVFDPECFPHGESGFELPLDEMLEAFGVTSSDELHNLLYLAAWFGAECALAKIAGGEPGD
jgi:hypothetical protein